MFYNPKTNESAERKDLCRRFNMSIPKAADKVSVYDENYDVLMDEWFLIDETMPAGGDTFYFVRTKEVEAREDGSYAYKYDRVDVPEHDPVLEVTIEDRISAVEDGLAEIAEILMEVM